MFKDYYKVFNLHKTASYQDIRKAYKKLVLAYHPDKNPTQDALEMFYEIQEAYSILSSDFARQIYDCTYDFYTGRVVGFHSRAYYNDNYEFVAPRTDRDQTIVDIGDAGAEADREVYGFSYIIKRFKKLFKYVNTDVVLIGLYIAIIISLFIYSYAHFYSLSL